MPLEVDVAGNLWRDETRREIGERMKSVRWDVRVKRGSEVDGTLVLGEQLCNACVTADASRCRAGVRGWRRRGDGVGELLPHVENLQQHRLGGYDDAVVVVLGGGARGDDGRGAWWSMSAAAH